MNTDTDKFSITHICTSLVTFFCILKITNVTVVKRTLRLCVTYSEETGTVAIN